MINIQIKGSLEHNKTVHLSRKKQTFHNECIVLKDNGGVIREQKSPRFRQNIFQVLSILISIRQLPPKSYQSIKAHQTCPFTLTNTSPHEVKRIMKSLKQTKLLDMVKFQLEPSKNPLNSCVSLSAV